MNSIHDICEKYNITNYTINDDGSIDVNGNVDLSYKNLTQLPLTFNKVYGNFYCNCNNLTTLKGGPKWVDRHFYCSHNQLTSLEFSPEYVGGYFTCEFNDYLTDNYCDTEIIGNFYTSLKQDGMIINSYDNVINYNEWRKIYKRKQILENIFSII